MPNTIAQNLERLTQAKSDIADAITAKGGTVNSGDGFEDFSADIATIPSGGGGADPDKPVKFYDYDGTLVYSYTAQEFSALTAMPANPSHTGLTAQGWNWSLSDAKAYVATYGALIIGQMYTTSDGKTHIHIHLEEDRLEPYLGLSINGSVDVDWGDGSAHDTMTGNRLGPLVSQKHVYTNAGDYIIRLSVNGRAALIGNYQAGSQILFEQTDTSYSSTYPGAIKEVHIGDNVTEIWGYAFYYCVSLQVITIPNSVTTLNPNAFEFSVSLKSIVIPNSVSIIYSDTFSNCYCLSSISIPNSVTNIGTRGIYNCQGLSSISIPDSVTSIANYAFTDCYNILSITIPNSITSIGNGAFSNLVSLKSILIPNSITKISNELFYECLNLSSIDIPSNITSIGSSAFSNCTSLKTITIPSSVTNLGSSDWGGVFFRCGGLSSIKFNSSTPPVATSYTFYELANGCTIYVPRGALSAYTSAANYPDPNTYTYEEYDP